MLGISTGQFIFTLGALVALVGPKDLQIIARFAGKLVGRSIGYVQLARGQLDFIMQQSQATKVHKELQDAMSQLDAIRHEIRSVSFMNPGPLTRTVENVVDQTPTACDSSAPGKVDAQKNKPKATISQDISATSDLSNMHSQATAFAKLASSAALNSGSVKSSSDGDKLNEESLPVLPVSAESAGLLPNRQGDEVKGSDIVLEAILEADVAHHAKDFFAQPQNHSITPKM